jgi:hypothetical protein
LRAKAALFLPRLLFAKTVGGRGGKEARRQRRQGGKGGAEAKAARRAPALDMSAVAEFIEFVQALPAVDGGTLGAAPDHAVNINFVMLTAVKERFMELKGGQLALPKAPELRPILEREVGSRFKHRITVCRVVDGKRVKEQPRDVVVGVSAEVRARCLHAARGPRRKRGMLARGTLPLLSDTLASLCLLCLLCLRAVPLTPLLPLVLALSQGLAAAALPVGAPVHPPPAAAAAAAAAAGAGTEEVRASLPPCLLASLPPCLLASLPPCLLASFASFAS